MINVFGKKNIFQFKFLHCKCNFFCIHDNYDTSVLVLEYHWMESMERTANGHLVGYLWLISMCLSFCLDFVLTTKPLYSSPLLPRLSVFQLTRVSLKFLQHGTSQCGGTCQARPKEVLSAEILETQFAFCQIHPCWTLVLAYLIGTLSENSKDPPSTV